MSRTGWAVADGRVRTCAALGLVIVLTLTACGGSTSPAPSSGSGGSVAPGETTGPGDTGAPEPTQGSGETVAPGDGSEAFSAATTALDALDSYAFRVEINSTSTTGTTTTSSRTMMSGVVVNSPAEASSLVQAELDDAGTITSGTEIVIIGAEAWLRSLPGDEPWTAIPAAQASAFTQSMAAFRPEQMFSMYFAGFGGNFDVVGTETKNGVETTRYTGDEAIGAMLGAIAGFQGSWSSEVWIANDGGFLVRSEASAQAATGADAGGYTIVVDITEPNSAGPIEPPA